jgi:hypothetical protein
MPHAIGPAAVVTTVTSVHRTITMPAIEAFILPPANPAIVNVRIGGLGLTERAILALHRGGVARIGVSNGCEMSAAMVRRLVGDGVPIFLGHESLMSSPTTAGRSLVVVSADVVFEPAAVRALVAKLASRNLPAVAAAEASPGTFAAFTSEGARSLHGAVDDRSLLGRMDGVRAAGLDTAFCRPIGALGDAPSIERSCVGRSRGLARVIARVARLLATRACLRLRMGTH